MYYAYAAHIAIRHRLAHKAGHLSSWQNDHLAVMAWQWIWHGGLFNI